MEHVSNTVWERFQVRSWVKVVELIVTRVNISDDYLWQFGSRVALIQACNEYLEIFGAPPMPIPRAVEALEVDRSVLLIQGVVEKMMKMLRPCFLTQPQDNEDVVSLTVEISDDDEGSSDDGDDDEVWTFADVEGNMYVFDEIDGAVPVDSEDEIDEEDLMDLSADMVPGDY
jgi:hypothetical protein